MQQSTSDVQVQLPTVGDLLVAGWSSSERLLMPAELRTDGIGTRSYPVPRSHWPQPT